MFRDELDMLEVRLAELDGSGIYRHVLVECRQDHRGAPKPLHYADNKERFSPWSDRIIHVIADLPDEPHPWAREHAQRNRIWTVLGDADPDDIVILADVDEIPSAEALAAVPDPVTAFRQRLMMYAVDWEYPQPMNCSVSARAGYARGGDASGIRDTRDSRPEVPGGFHLTWLGGVEAQRRKLGVHCHLEMTGTEHDRIWSGACYERGVHHGDGGLMMIPADVDETWPRLIFERKCPANWFRPRPAEEAA